MIHHISLPAKNPQHVAEVLAELFEGYCAPFPSHPGSYVAFAADEHGTVIEVYPFGTEMTPGEGEQSIQFRHQNNANQFIASHAAISVALNQSEIESIAEREQWRCVRCSRGYFDVIELWLENSVLVELTTPELTQQYLAVLSPENLVKHFAEQKS